MKKVSLEMADRVNKILQSNALILFNQNSDAIRFEYQRHICSKIEEIPGKTQNEKIYNSIVIAAWLWISWEIHIKKSSYPYEWYGCIQVENKWLLEGKNTPPFIIFNSKIPEKIKNYDLFKFVKQSEFPINLETIDVLANRKIKVKKAFFNEDKSIVWRICYL